jgi:hypothetical protein
MTEPNVLDLKGERVQEESLARMRKRVAGEGDALGSAMAVSRSQANQPLRVSVVGSTIVLALTGRSKGPDRGITEGVLDLAEQLG